MDSLQQSISDCITADDYSEDTLMKLLSPVSDYAQNKLFIEYIQQIVDILITNPDGTVQFSIAHLTALSKDTVAITSLISNIFLAISSVPSLNLKYTSGDSEDIVFKMLVYIFLVV